MIICGIKYTHDGAVALLEDNRLVFCIEMEKLGNSPRYCGMSNTIQIQHILKQYGLSVDDVDIFSIDGWNSERNIIHAQNESKPFELKVAPYIEKKLSDDIMHDFRGNGLKIGSKIFSYSSFMHVTNHVLGAYCTSPFGMMGESSYLLVWDGGMFPRLYFFDAQKKKIENFGKLFFMLGSFYADFAIFLDTYKSYRNSQNIADVPGKVMAYIAKGQPREEIVLRFEQIYNNKLRIELRFVDRFFEEFNRSGFKGMYSDADILSSLHTFIEKLLLRTLKEKLDKYPRKSRNLCFAGGCALNIKWNSAIRSSGLFDHVFVPPFPNDSGSAIGAALSAMTVYENNYTLAWSVYSGPQMIAGAVRPGWSQTKLHESALAQLLHETNKPVVFLNEKAELGPRALGNRSILAAPTSPEMKELLNTIKDREGYRPVAPICLEDDATKMFDPGTPDPFMLYDHMVRPEWRDVIPAICHLDNTARLQTVNRSQNPVIHRLLKEYKTFSGVGVLCNTSANLKGKGFFPDVDSAMDWGKVDFIWHDGVLTYKMENQSIIDELVKLRERNSEEMAQVKLEF